MSGSNWTKEVSAERVDISRNTTQDRVQETRDEGLTSVMATKAKAQRESTEVNRKVKKRANKDKRNYTDSLAEEAEEAAAKGNIKDLNNANKKLSGKISKPEQLVKDKEGKTMTGLEQEQQRFQLYLQHFELWKVHQAGN